MPPVGALPAGRAAFVFNHFVSSAPVASFDDSSSAYTCAEHNSNCPSDYHHLDDDDYTAATSSSSCPSFYEHHFGYDASVHVAASKRLLTTDVVARRRFPSRSTAHRVVTSSSGFRCSSSGFRFRSGRAGAGSGTHLPAHTRAPLPASSYFDLDGSSTARHDGEERRTSTVAHLSSASSYADVGCFLGTARPFAHFLALARGSADVAGAVDDDPTVDTVQRAVSNYGTRLRGVPAAADSRHGPTSASLLSRLVEPVVPDAASVLRRDAPAASTDAAQLSVRIARRPLLRVGANENVARDVDVLAGIDQSLVRPVPASDDHCDAIDATDGLISTIGSATTSSEPRAAVRGAATARGGFVRAPRLPHVPLPARRRSQGSIPGHGNQRLVGGRVIVDGAQNQAPVRSVMERSPDGAGAADALRPGAACSGRWRPTRF